MAEPEKALLDLWHLEPGKWDRPRMAEMRFQDFGLVQPERLSAYAARFASPRLESAAEIWLALGRAEGEGTVNP